MHDQDTGIVTATTKDNKQADPRGQRNLFMPQRTPNLEYFIFEEIADSCLYYHIAEYVGVRV